MKLTNNFSRYEFACKGSSCCGNSAPIDLRLVAELQRLRDIIGMPIRITSGFRCITHNKRVGGDPRSYHTLGMAADIVTRMKPQELIDIIKKNNIPLFVLAYPSWVHVDTQNMHILIEK